MSNLSDGIKVVLKEIFPYAKLKEEHYVRYKGRKLFFDFFLPQYNILIEVQGKQHYEFVQHFHSDVEGFRDSRRRDRLKVEYAEVTGITLVNIDYNEHIDRIKLIEKIAEAQND